MEKEGIVSIWLGLSDSMEEFQGYLQVYYTEEIDFINSQFEKDFEIQCFDEDLREISFIEQASTSFSLLFSKHSYCESIVSNYLHKHGDELDRQYNSIILLYDYNYTGSIKDVSHKGLFIKFLGAVDYNRDK